MLGVATGTRTAGVALRLGRWQSPDCRGFRPQEWPCGSPSGKKSTQGKCPGGPEAPASAPNPAAAQREPQGHHQRRKGTVKL